MRCALSQTIHVPLAAGNSLEQRTTGAFASAITAWSMKLAMPSGSFEFTELDIEEKFTAEIF